MSDHTAKIRAKGTDATGLTEDLAAKLYARKGSRIIAIVELHAVERHEKADGSKRVDLVIDLLEPAEDDTVAEHLREITRTLYNNRALADGQLTIDQSLEPKVADVLAKGAQHAAHPFLPVNPADDDGICDVCGKVEGANPAHADRSRIRDPFTVHEGGLGQDDDADQPALGN